MQADESKTKVHPWRRYSYPGRKPSANFSALLLKRIDKHLAGKDCRMAFGKGLYSMQSGDIGDLLRSAATSNWKTPQLLADKVVKQNAKRTDGVFATDFEQVKELRRWDAHD